MIIRKFTLQLNQSPINKYPKKNCTFLILSVLNTIFFVVYIFLSLRYNNHIEYYLTFYRTFHVICTSILVYYCCLFINIINKQNSYERLKKKSIESKKSNNSDVKELNNNKSESNRNSEIVINNKINRDKTYVMIEDVIVNDNELFYSRKKCQLIVLSLFNILCAISQIIYIIFRSFVLNNDYYDSEYRTIPKTLTGMLFYYNYIIFSNLNIVGNFIAFYLLIKDQFKITNGKLDVNSSEILLKFLDSDLSNNKNSDVSQFLSNDKEYVNLMNDSLIEDLEQKVNRVSNLKLVPDNENNYVL